MSDAPVQKANAKAAELRELQMRLRAMTATERVRTIIDRPDVMRVVRALPVQEIFVTLKEVGPSDALELVELMSPAQVQGVLDLDAWRRDRLDPAQLGEWLEILYAANPDRAVKQIAALDLELLSLVFKMFTRIYDIKEGEDIPENPKLHSISPDQRYLIAYDEADGRLAHALKQTVDRMFGTDLEFVIHLIESVRWETPSHLEETSFRWRSGRLADYGFAPPGDAQEVFAFVDPDDKLARAPAEVPEPLAFREDDEDPPPDLSTSVLLPDELLSGSGQSVLARALALADEKVRRRFTHELIGASNRLHMATGGDLGDPASLKETVQRASDTIGVGLSYLAKGEPDRLAEPLTRLTALELFQAGHSLTMRIARELRARIRAEGSGLGGEGMLRLDTPLRETVAGLLRPQPLLFGGLMDPAREDYVPFSSLQEIARASQAASEAAFRAELSARGLGVTDERMKELGVDDARTGPSHGALVGAFLARVIVAEPTSIEPLDDDALRRLHARMKVGDFTGDDVARAQTALGAVAEGLAPLAGAPTADEAEERAAAFAGQVLHALAVELGAVAADDVDGRFVRAAFTAGSLDATPEEDEDEDTERTDEE